MNDQDREDRPVASAFLVTLQILGMALCVLIAANMLFEYQSPPIPACPKVAK